MSTPLAAVRQTSQRFADCHMHSSLSGHASATVEEMVAALAAHPMLLGGIFTEHLPLPASIDPEQQFSMRAEDLPAYVATLHTLRKTFPMTQLVIGAEADWLNHDPQQTVASVEAARKAGVEVVLGSVHLLDGLAIDDPHAPGFWDTRSVEEVWELYFTEWCRAASSGLFDVMAHPDLPKKFGRVPADVSIYYSEAARVAAQAGVLCEVSTAGLRKPCAELYPAPPFIAELALRGVNLTLASDAHAPDELGYRLDVAAEILAALDISRVAFPQGEGKMQWLDLY